MRIFDYSNCPERETVVIAGGGLSLGRGIDRVVTYIQKHKPLVFSANYHHPQFPIDYTYFTDKTKYYEQIKNIRSPNIISAYWGITEHPQFIYYYVGTGVKKTTSIYGEPAIKVDEGGHFPYYTLGTAGFGAMLVATLAKPKRMLIAGFDGSNIEKGFKFRFDGKKVAYTKPGPYEWKRHYFLGVLIPYIQSLGTQVQCLKIDPVWGANKQALGLVEI